MMDSFRFASFSSCGQPEEVLEISSAPLRELAEGEIAVRMLAAPINPSDVNFVQGVYGLKPSLPESPAGLEGCGVVVQSRAEGFVPGDQVILISGVGSWAEFMVAPAASFLRLEKSLPPLQAAMLKVNPLTAWLLLSSFVELKPGDWVVQNAANSGVGCCFIQLARRMGLRSVNVLRRADSRREALLAMGADVVLDEEDPDIRAHMLEATGGARPLLASNCVGGESALRLMDMLAPRGTMVTFGAMSKKSIKVPNSFLIFRELSLRGLWCSRWLRESSPEAIAAAYRVLVDAVADGSLVQPVEQCYELADVRAAAAHAQRESRGGKVMLRLGEF